MIDISPVARRLRDLVEPAAANVYFAEEATDGYRALGLNYFEGYFCSRGACLGQPPWSVVAATFGAFKPAVVERAVTSGWTKTTPDAILAARLDGATASLQRIVGDPPVDLDRATELLARSVEGVDPSGRALYAGLSALPEPDTAWGRFWRAADRVREHRGDGHVASWTPVLDSCEVTVLSELAWGMPARTYVFTRGYDETDVDAAYRRLTGRGLIADGALTDAGRTLRGDVEDRTDESVREVIEHLGDDAEELFEILESISRAIIDAGGYPVDPARMHNDSDDRP